MDGEGDTHTLHESRILTYLVAVTQLVFRFSDKRSSWPSLKCISPYPPILNILYTRSSNMVDDPIITSGDRYIPHEQLNSLSSFLMKDLVERFE